MSHISDYNTELYKLSSEKEGKMSGYTGQFRCGKGCS